MKSFARWLAGAFCFSAAAQMPPFPPLIVNPLLNTPRAVALSWEPCPATNAVAYRVYFYTNLPAFTLDVGNVTNAIVTNLLRPYPWNFYVTALDADGNESAPSNLEQWPPANTKTNVVVNYSVDGACASWTNPAAPARFFRAVVLASSNLTDWIVWTNLNQKISGTMAQ